MPKNQEAGFDDVMTPCHDGCLLSGQVRVHLPVSNSEASAASVCVSDSRFLVYRTPQRLHDVHVLAASCRW